MVRPGAALALGEGALAQGWALARGGLGEHLVVVRGSRTLRLDIVVGSLMDGPVALDILFPIDHRWRQRRAGLARLGLLTGEDDAGAPARDPGLARLVEGLRALDALDDGASLREIGRTIVGDDWPGPGDSIKSRARRLAAYARHLRAAGPRAAFG